MHSYSYNYYVLLSGVDNFFELEGLDILDMPLM